LPGGSPGDDDRPVPRPLLDRFDADGFAVVERLVAPERLGPLHDAFDRLFAGDFATGTPPDEVNWQHGTGDPTLTRQICNAWKADPVVAEVVLDPGFGEDLARLAGWPGARIIQDNVLWKPPGARSVGFHQDNGYLAWYTPQEMCTCWIALDDTSAEGGTLTFARGSHRWPIGDDPGAEFHAPDDHTAAVEAAARASGRAFDPAPVEVAAGGGSFHHGWTWHGSGPNRGDVERRARVIHCASSEARFHRPGFSEGNGPVYSRYARPDDDAMDEAHFPILWRSDGYRTSGLPDPTGVGRSG